MARKTGSSGDKTVAAVRKAALQLFARQGYAAVSMRRLASEVGMQASALYNYWPTKQDLLVDLLDLHMQELLTAWQEELRARPPANHHGRAGRTDPERAEVRARDPLWELDHFARFHIAYHLKRPHEVFIAYMELRSLEPQNFKHHEKLRRRYEDVLRDILRRGAEQGLFDVPDVKIAAMAIIAMLTGVNHWYRRAGRLSRAAIEDIYAQMALRMVGVADVDNALVQKAGGANTGSANKARRKAKPMITAKGRKKCSPAQ